MDKVHHMILRDTAKALTHQGLKTDVAAANPRATRGPEIDGTLRFRFGGRETLRTVELKRYVTPATLGAIHAQLTRRADRPLLVTEYITPPLADRLRELGIQFADTAGNAYLETPNFLVWTKGNPRPKQKPDEQPTGRAFEPSGLKIVFALLCDPTRLERPYRNIAQETGVAHGTVGWVMADLDARGFIAQLRGRHQPRRLVQADKLLTQWAEAYARKLRPKLVRARFRQSDPNRPLAIEPRTEQTLLGGEPAAALLTQYLRPATYTLYAERVDPKLVLEHRLIADPKGNVEFLEKFWKFATPQDPPPLAPLPLVYADLLAIGDARTIEVAHKLHEQIIDRLER